MKAVLLAAGIGTRLNPITKGEEDPLSVVTAINNGQYYVTDVLFINN